MHRSQPSSRVAANVRAELARRRLTGSDLAKAIGLTQGSLSRRTTGVQPFSIDELHDVADFLGVSVVDLLGHEPQRLDATG